MEVSKLRQKLFAVATGIILLLTTFAASEALIAAYFLSVSKVYYRPQYLRLRTDDSFWTMLTEYQPWGAWHRPNATATHQMPCFSVQYATNSIGARDSEKSATGSEGGTIFIGDSFIEGYGVEKAARISDLFAAATKKETLNLGSSGSLGPLQYWMIYEKFAPTFPHSNVVIGFLPYNDFTDNDPDYENIGESWKNDNYRYRPYYRLNGTDYEIFYKGKQEVGRTFTDFRKDLYSQQAAARLLDYTWLGGLLKVWHGQLPPVKMDLSAMIVADGYFQTSPQRIDATFHFLRKLVDAAKGKKVYILVIPSFYEAVALRSRQSPWLPDFVKQFSSPDTKVIDFGPVFSSLSDAELSDAYLSCDGHWSARGNKIAFDTLMSHIAE